VSTTITPEHLDLGAHAGRQIGGLIRLAGLVELDSRLVALVEIRTSQINGCESDVDVARADARAAGETEERLHMLETWRECSLYDARERAALALTEAVTLIAEDDVSAEVWGRAVAEFEPDDLAQLLFAVAVTNAWNRLTITTRVEAEIEPRGAAA
jgi:AhpD family alkylhydroperoxidase